MRRTGRRLEKADGQAGGGARASRAGNLDEQVAETEEKAEGWADHGAIQATLLLCRLINRYS